MTRNARVLARASLIVLAIIAAVVLWEYEPTRTEIRWLTVSGGYKARVLAQPTPLSEELKHVEWDGWGFVSMYTTEYLVYDPTDSLAVAASSGEAGKFAGLPCKVPVVRKMERGWYVVRFYTEQAWGNCYEPS